MEERIGPWHHHTGEGRRDSRFPLLKSPEPRMRKSSGRDVCRSRSRKRYVIAAAGLDESPTGKSK